MEILLYEMLIWERKISLLLKAFSQETVLEEKKAIWQPFLDLKKNMDVQQYSGSHCTKYKAQLCCDIEKTNS